MMKNLVLMSVVLLALSCNGSGGGGGAGGIGQIGTGSGGNTGSENNSGSTVSAQQVSKEFIQASTSTIEPALRIQQGELETWSNDGILTPEEAQEISQNI